MESFVRILKPNLGFVYVNINDRKHNYTNNCGNYLSTQYENVFCLN